MFLGELIEGCQSRPPEQSESPRIRLDAKVTQLTEQPVEQIKTDPSRPRFPSGPADGEDDLGAGLPSGDEFWDEFGRILQVGIHRDGGIGVAGIHESRGQRGLMTEVTREIHQPETIVETDPFGDEFGGAVQAAIVHENDAPVGFQCGGEHRVKPSKQFREDFSLIVDRDDDGDSWLSRQDAPRA